MEDIIVDRILDNLNAQDLHDRMLIFDILIDQKNSFPKEDIHAVLSLFTSKKANGDFDNTDEYLKIIEVLKVFKK